MQRSCVIFNLGKSDSSESVSWRGTNMLSKKIIKTSFVSTATIAALLLSTTFNAPVATAASDSVPAEFQNSIDWKQFSGTTLALGAQTHPWMNAMVKLIPQFEEMTGIKVQYELLGEDVAVPKIQQQLAGGATTPDLFMVNAFGQAASAGWLEPLNGYIADPKLTDSKWYNISDLFKAARSFANVGGKQLALPITAEVQTLFVRTDLIKTIPKTSKDLIKIAKGATKGAVSGFSSRAIANSNETPWPFGGFAFSNGGEYINAAGKPVLNSAENIAAANLYAKLQKFSPKGSSNWAWKDNYAAMCAGTLAMFPDSSGFTAGLRGKDCKPGTNIGAYPLPTINGGSKPNVWFWTVGINSKSANKKAAWLFLQWATSAPVTAKSQADVTTARGSAWSDPVGALAMGAANSKRIAGILAAADSKPMAQAWQNPKWPAVADVLARAVNKIVTSGNAKKELDAAQKKAVKILS